MAQADGDDRLPEVAMEDLPEHERELLMQFLVENDVRFSKDADGSFVSTMEMYDREAVEASGMPLRAGDEEDDSDPDVAREQRRARAAARGGRSDDAQAVLGEMRREAARDVVSRTYPGIAALICPRDQVRPKQRPLPWVMRLIEEIYDAKYEADTAGLKEEDDAANKEGEPMPSFVRQYFFKRYGLPKLVDTTCWDLLSNVHALRRDDPAADLFGRFMEEAYDTDDLLFFLYVRSTIQKELSINFRQRWGEMGRRHGGGKPAQVMLSPRECAVVAHVVFGSDSDPPFRTFMALLEGQFEGRRARGQDHRRINATAFLQLAVDEYHDMRPADEEQGEEQDEEQASVGAAGSGAGAAAEEDSGASELTAQERRRLLEEADRVYAHRGKGEGDGGDSAGAGAGADDAASAGGAADGGVTAELLDRLSMVLGEANDEYVAALLADTSDLDPTLVKYVRDELSKALAKHVDGLLEAAINEVQRAPGADPDRDPVAASLSIVLNGGGDEDVDAFAQTLLAVPSIRESMEPMAAMLIDYVRKGKQQQQQQQEQADGGADQA